MRNFPLLRSVWAVQVMLRRLLLISSLPVVATAIAAGQVRPQAGSPEAIVTPASLVLTAGGADAGVMTPRSDGELGRHLELVQFSSEALKGNLIGDPHQREFAVLLPPSYFAAQDRRYPTVYLLHGLGKRADGHLQTIGVMRAAFREMNAGRLAEMILVAVDGSTSFGGSYYANSPTIGNFEKYVVKEIVSRVDGRFRSVQSHRGRAVAGFSMGGHGALKLAMKYPGNFSAVGSLSGSPMSIRYRKSIYKDALNNRKRPDSLRELVGLYTYEDHWSTAAAYAKAAAFSPNPGRPPLFLNLPFEKPGPDLEDPTWQLWLDDDPLSLVAKNQKALRAMNLIYIDHGDNETALGTEDFDRELVRYGIGHTHYIFRGDHSEQYIDRHLRMLRQLSVSWSHE